MVQVARRFEIRGGAANANRFELAEFEAGEIEELFESDVPGGGASERRTHRPHSGDGEGVPRRERSGISRKPRRRRIAPPSPPRSSARHRRAMRVIRPPPRASSRSPASRARRCLIFSPSARTQIENMGPRRSMPGARSMRHHVRWVAPERTGAPWPMSARARHSIRRAFLALAGCGIAASNLAQGCSRKEAPVLPQPVVAGVVRVASVKTAVEGNVLPELISDFEKASSFEVELAPGEDSTPGRAKGRPTSSSRTMGTARRRLRPRRARRVAAHDFQQPDGARRPARDPAGIRGLEDAGEAFRRIAATKSKFVLNDIEGVRYLDRSSGTPLAGPIARAGSSTKGTGRTARSSARRRWAPTRSGA